MQIGRNDMSNEELEAMVDKLLVDAKQNLMSELKAKPEELSQAPVVLPDPSERDVIEADRKAKEEALRKEAEELKVELAKLKQENEKLVSEAKNLTAKN